MSRVPIHLHRDPFARGQREPERRLEVLVYVQYLLRRAQQEHEAGNYAARDQLVDASQWWLRQMWYKGKPCYRW